MNPALYAFSWADAVALAVVLARTSRRRQRVRSVAPGAHIWRIEEAPRR